MRRSPDELKAKLTGVIGFGVTPFRNDFSIDLEALRENARQLAETCDVVVALGNNGEIFSLSCTERQLVGQAVVDEVRGRKPVLIGVGFCLPEARELAQAAERNGADGILALPPHVPSADEDGLFAYYQSIASAVDIGVVLFQNSSLTFSPSLLCRLAGIPNIVGMKDEHGDMKVFVRQIAAVGQRISLICGVGEILAPSYFALGVHAFTTGLVNFMPQTPLKILGHLRAGQLEAASRLVPEILPIFDLRRKRPGYTTVVIKEAMELCGMKAGPVRPPLTALRPEDRKELQGILASLGICK